MAKRPDWKKLIISILIPLAVGGAAALIANGNFKDFEALNKPPLAPPAWAFPAAWTLLYIGRDAHEDVQQRPRGRERPRRRRKRRFVQRLEILEATVCNQRRRSADGQRYQY